MRIAIIGAGNIGGNLARRLGPLGHDVRLANSRGPETLTAFAEVPGVTPVARDEAANGAELVVVTIPMKALPDLPADLLAGAPDAAVLDTNNYYPQQRDGAIAALEQGGQTESEWVAEQLGRTVVKAFNGVYAQRILDAGEEGHTPFAIPVAGDDAAAKALVMGLATELGFLPVDAGGLADSWRQQPGTPGYGAETDVDGVRAALAAATRERPTAFTA